MSDAPFFTIVGVWPWQWVIYHTPTKRKQTLLPAPPKEPEKVWRLVDLMAEQLGFSRGKARKEVQLGRVLVDDKVELNADRSLTSTNRIAWAST